MSSIPCELRRLRADAARSWGAAKSVVGLLAPYDITVGPAGELAATTSARTPAPPELVARAVEELSCTLEDVGYDVERQGDARRVLGWARASGSGQRGPRARLVELDPWDPRVEARRRRLIDERAQRHPSGVGPDAKREAGIEAARAHARSVR